MLTLVNTNTMQPAVGPLGLEYIGDAARAAGTQVELVDLCLAAEPDSELERHFARHSPRLVGLSFRNVDDCFWPSATWFVPDLAEIVGRIRDLSDAPVVIGGVGFAIFAEQIVEYTGADFGVRGDGEPAIPALYAELVGNRRFEKVPGLIWRDNSMIRSNEPAWRGPLSLPTARGTIDNASYLERGGQCGVETKRGCNRKCVYCADRLAKGTAVRLRDPKEVADEAEGLVEQGIDVLHLCDAEFNVPGDHARMVCEEFIRRSLAKKVRWYTYMAVVPFDAELAESMRRAGCVGIDFTGDSASAKMLQTYRQRHRAEDLAHAVRLCRENGIKVMIDLLLGGPGETPQTVAETIGYMKKIGPDCVGAPLGIRLYPGTQVVEMVRQEGPMEQNSAIRRKYGGVVDLFKPTFYISEELGPRPAQLVKDLIGGDQRFFEPTDEQAAGLTQDDEPKDHNYNDNADLVDAIAAGARGAYWDILHKLRTG